MFKLPLPTEKLLKCMAITHQNTDMRYYVNLASIIVQT